MGCGAVGRRVALRLAEMGISELVLFDSDNVGPENIGNQGFSPIAIGSNKAEVVAGECLMRNPDLAVTAVPALFDEMTMPPPDMRRYMFCCVDSMDARSLVARYCYSTSVTFVDFRMFGFFGQVFCKRNGVNVMDYLSTLVPQGEQYGGNCTQLSAPWTSDVIVGLGLNEWVCTLHPPLPVTRAPYLSIDLRTMALSPIPIVCPPEGKRVLLEVDHTEDFGEGDGTDRAIEPGITSEHLVDQSYRDRLEPPPEIKDAEEKPATSADESVEKFNEEVPDDDEDLVTVAADEEYDDDGDNTDDDDED